MTLKTLKDIRGGPTVHRKDVKAEAVKWVKKERISFLSWVEFFNITESDLEEEEK